MRAIMKCIVIVFLFFLNTANAQYLFTVLQFETPYVCYWIVDASTTPQDREMLIEEIRRRGATCESVSALKQDGISEAKSKCADLGFKQGTEGFGKCVLKLSK